MKKIDRVTIILAFSVLFVHLTIFVRYAIIELFIADYFFLFLFSKSSLIISIVIAIIVPIALFLIALLLLKIKQKRSWNYFLASMCTIILVLWLIPTCFFEYNLGTSPFISYTDEIENYNVYDDSVRKIIEDNGLISFLPDKMLINENCKYNYNYFNLFGEPEFSIELEIEFSDIDSYENEITRIINALSSTAVIIDNIFYDYFGVIPLISVGEMPWKNPSIKNHKIIIKNDSERVIKYIIEYGKSDSILSQVIDGTRDSSVPQN